MMIRFGMLSILVACSGKSDDEPSTGGSATGTTVSSGTSTTPSSTTSGTTTTSSVPPCVGESWGTITDPEGAVHVRENGDDSADGSAAAPLATLDAALTVLRAGAGTGTIAIGPGEFVAGIDLAGDEILGEGINDDGVALQGCGVDETILLADDDEEPIIRVTSASDIALSGFGLEGGRRALWIWGGATVTVESVAIAESTKVGVVVKDGTTEVSFTDVHVSDIVAESDYGYGFNVDGAVVQMTDSSVIGATGIGILASGATLDLDTVIVQETARNASDLLGRGIQLQGSSSGTLQDCMLVGNADAAVFSRQSPNLSVDGIVVEEVEWAQIPLDKAGALSGDGLVATGADEVSNYNPALFLVSVTNSQISNADRAGVVLEHLTAELSDNQIQDCAFTSDDGVSVFLQDDVAISGNDSTVELSAGGEIEPLSLNRDEVALDLLDN